MVLQGKKEVFAQAIAAGMNKVEACIQAGYSEKTAPQQASRLAKSADVVARVKELTPAVKRSLSEVNDFKPAGSPAADPKAFLFEVMADDEADMKTRIDAAKTLMPYLYGKVGEVGKKETKRENAQKKSEAGGLSARLEENRLKKVK